jgi:hypothetical protein
LTESLNSFSWTWIEHSYILRILYCNLHKISYILSIYVVSKFQKIILTVGKKWTLAQILSSRNEIWNITEVISYIQNHKIWCTTLCEIRNLLFFIDLHQCEGRSLVNINVSKIYTTNFPRIINVTLVAVLCNCFEMTKIPLLQQEDGRN